MSSKFKTIFHTAIFAYVYLMIALTIPTNFSVTAPNQSSTVNTLIHIDGKNQTSHLKSMSVLTMTRITGFGRMLYELSSEFDVKPLTYVESTLSQKEMNLRGQIQKNASFEQSLITAYELAHLTDPSVHINYKLTGMIIDYRTPEYSMLKIGDIIIDINNQNFTDYESMGQYFIDYDGILNLKVLRADKTMEVSIEKNDQAIFRFYPKYEIISASPTYSLPGQNTSLGGPSAGMMYTLSIYFALIDYTLIDVDIAGTGTIRYNGEIGRIGGLPQKIYGAHKEGIKHFLIPSSHYNEVKQLSHLINLYPVDTIEDAIEVVMYEILT